jgi:geranylgeranyl pyrophosphate synthase
VPARLCRSVNAAMSHTLESTLGVIVTAGEIRREIASVEALGEWPQVALLLPEDDASTRLDWQLPLRTCRAVGGDPSLALPAVAGLACVKISCILVDDILDEDPRGIHTQIGSGRSANLALALLAASTALLARCRLAPDRLAVATASLGRMALEGALGQELDARFAGGEPEYWRIVRAKGGPFYGGALEVGAIIGGSPLELAAKLYHLGELIGESVQLYDDIEDAFVVPAAPDWSGVRPNLPILYGRQAGYPGAERFRALLPAVSDPGALAEAQRLLLSSGAVSYAIYHLLQRHAAARRCLSGLELVDPEPLSDLLGQLIGPLFEWAKRQGVSLPEAIVQGRE